MAGVTGGPVGGVTTVAAGFASSPSGPPVLSLGPSAVVDAPGPARAVAAFALVATLGLVLLWRYGAFVDRSTDASVARPLSSLVHGVAAHAVIAFGAVYMATQLAGFDVLGRNAGAVGLLLGLLLALLAGSLGFTVVGSTLAGLGGALPRWSGPVVGAVIAGVAGLLDPLHGGFIWFVVVSMGIGGAARRWLHADEVDAARTGR